MKRYGYLADFLLDHSFMVKAIKEAAKGKNLKKRRDIAKVLADPDYYADKAIFFIQNRLYVPAKPGIRIIKERYSGKVRKIEMIPFFPDAVIQTAMVLALQPIILKRMDPYSCGHVRGRGPQKCLTRIKSVLRKLSKSRRGKPAKVYYLYQDVHHFYASIDQGKLEAMLRRIIKDRYFLELIIACFKVASRGLIIGTALSVWLSSLYLCEVDRLAHRCGVRYLVHYADDIVWIGVNRRKLVKAKGQTDRFLSTLGLCTKDSWKCRAVQDCPLRFLSWRFCLRGKTMLKKDIWKDRGRMLLKPFQEIARRLGSAISKLGIIKSTNHLLIDREYGYMEKLTRLRSAMSLLTKGMLNGPNPKCLPEGV